MLSESETKLIVTDIVIFWPNFTANTVKSWLLNLDAFPFDDIEKAVAQMKRTVKFPGGVELYEIADSIRRQRRDAEETAARQQQEREERQKLANRTPEQIARTKFCMAICSEHLTGALPRTVTFEAELERRMTQWYAEQLPKVGNGGGGQ